jgi:hypothetical protein
LKCSSRICRTASAAPESCTFACRIERRALRAQLLALLVDDAFAAHDHDVLLQLVQLAHALHQRLHPQRRFGHQRDVRLAEGRAERDVAGLPAHHLDDRDAAVALGGGADAADALGRDVDRGGVAGRDVVDDPLEVEARARRHALVVIAGAAWLRHALPLVGLVPVVEAEVVVDRLRSEHHRQPLRQRLQPVERAVAADADQAVDLQPREPGGDLVERLAVGRVHVRPRGADDGAAARRVQLGDLGEQRVQVHVRDVRREQRAEALDEAEDLDLALVGARHRALDGGVERGRVAACRQDADAFHGR